MTSDQKVAQDLGRFSSRSMGMVPALVSLDAVGILGALASGEYSYPFNVSQMEQRRKQVLLPENVQARQVQWSGSLTGCSDGGRRPSGWRDVEAAETSAS